MLTRPPNRIWREDYNPLSGLTLSTLIAWEAEADRGAHSSLQWFYHHMEKADVTISAAVDRRISMIEKTDWEIRLDENADLAIAQEQGDLLRHAYQQLTNLRSAISHLARGIFTGHAHVEKLYKRGNPFPVELDPIDPWFWVREGMRGPWQLNPDSSGGITEGTKVDPRRIVVLEVRKPIHRAVSRHFYAKALGMADWDTALENGANQTIFVVGPPGADTDKAKEMQAIAEKVVTNGRGWLPDKTEVKAFDLAARGTLPYVDRIKYCDEQIVLAATGGKLSMLTESGSGTLAGGAHSDSLVSLAESDAQRLSEVFQKQFDAQLLELFFPGQPVCAYFQLDVPKTEDVAGILANVGNLTWAGFAPDQAWLEEKTGMKLTKIPPPGG
jgi:phage gp29-like protein